MHVIYPNYLNEILPSQKAREITTSMQNLIYDAFIIPLAFYYQFICKDWVYSQQFSIVVSVLVILFMIVFSYESPEFLYS